MTCGGNNGTDGSHFPVFSEDVVFAHHFEVPCLPPTLPRSHLIGVLVVLATPVKNYLKWWEIKLAIQCTVDTVIYSIVTDLWRNMCMQAALIILEVSN